MNNDFMKRRVIKTSRKSYKSLTGSESGVKSSDFLDFTAPGVFGDLLARLQTED
ncbi:hypothetical protein FD31_GL001483 [Companilactobacillus nantensis DSM 16982]|uniref:Uncharacterized protein n=1 Tax=Companilactobacillus nantensis DSM 16982 TaxID=1423774 RepID=A0A0R1WAY4_9LACO|nr:hypothetical protein FD31_GL001483 [Companilactobacillus nantensis DSM 16982]